MNAAYRKKLRDLKRLYQKKRQRVYMIRRISAVAILVLLIVLIILGIRGCGKSKASSGPVVTVIPAETVSPYTPAPMGRIGNVTKSDINQGFFKNSCFVGNSVIESMEIYELLDNTDYFAKIGLNVTDASKVAMTNGTVPVIDELNNDKQYSRIFMMFGENELNWPSIDTFKADYAKLIKKAKRYHPSAKVYVLSVTPVSKTADSQQHEGVTKEAIESFNEHLKDIAEENNATYVDLFTALSNGNGFLPEDAATDGIHFGEDYYIKALVCMQNTQ